MPFKSSTDVNGVRVVDNTPLYMFDRGYDFLICPAILPGTNYPFATQDDNRLFIYVRKALLGETY